MQYMGDISKIHGRDVPPVDCIIGGSPCQDLSVAGKRAGLDGDCSGLFMEQIRIVREMRENHGTAYPRFMVWENVCGAMSSNGGKDFGKVLEACVRIPEPEAPAVPVPEKGWPGAGLLYDQLGRWSVAWRIHDAQFWGVPQRRRRIALVADFGGLAAPEVLFIRKSLSGNTEACRTPWETASRSAESSAGKAGGGLNCGQCYVFKGGNGAKAGISLSNRVAPTLTSAGSGTNQAPTICIQGNCIDRADTAKCNGCGWHEDVSYTLNTIDRPAVYDTRGNGNTEVAYTIVGDHESHVSDYTTIVMETGQSHTEILNGISPTLNCNHEQPVVIGLDSNHGAHVDRSGTIRSHEGGGASENVYAYGKIRRLTPLECERLQGYPDGWTDIGEWYDSRGKLHKTSDSARYKALGNSIALPFWKWLIKRISSQYERDVKMASLFDGIGGFPYLWEQINGVGSCLWASEINEFCIAVTKKRIGQV